MVNEALLVEESNTPFFLFDDLSSFRGSPGISRHEAEGNPFRPKGSSAGMQEVHRSLKGDLELMMPRDAVRILLGSISVGVHVVPDEVSDMRKAPDDPSHRLVEMVGVVAADDGVDVAGDPQLRDKL